MKKEQLGRTTCRQNGERVIYEILEKEFEERTAWPNDMSAEWGEGYI